MKVTLEGSLKEDAKTQTVVVENRETLQSVIRPGAPSGGELQRARLILDLSAFFDVPLAEARRWVEETERELETAEED